MNNKILIFLLFAVVVISLFSGCTKKDIITGEGEIKYIDLEGGFYGLISSDGSKYDPVNLPDEYKIDGLPVEFELYKIDGAVSIHMWGEIVYINEIHPVGTVGFMTNSFGCKNDTRSRDSDLDCIQYEFENNKLNISHINAGFNCCPIFYSDLNVNNNIITIVEVEVEGNCRCLCLFDLDFVVFNLEPGEYTFKFIEPYVDATDEKIEFTVNLSSEPTGSFCVKRNYYPWD